MIEFIFMSVLMVSLSAMLYLMVRALPRVSPEEEGERHGLLDRWAHSQIPEKIDHTLNGFLLKFLRRLRVLILRIDNTLSRHLQRVKPEDGEKRANIDFKEIAGQNKEGNGGENI